MALVVPQEKWEILVLSPDCFHARQAKLKADGTTEMVGPPIQAMADAIDRRRLMPKDFVKGMMARMGVSFHKYGSFFDKFPEQATGLDQIEQRIQLYRESGNVEWLIDAANYCMIEAACPSHSNAHFRATSAEESPGRIDRDGSVSHGHN